tara:strand:+ start:450 stop:602 length:153 start_codon:yes stop_codon:yes gene_type:complete
MVVVMLMLDVVERKAEVLKIARLREAIPRANGARAARKTSALLIRIALFK